LKDEPSSFTLTIRRIAYVV
jgi:hypothetical protein